ncbi:kunitz-type protease inhibitor 2 isoform X1 [Antechinus flavipes]|uniref:kunitz-type protease inhibitor 2 isoform X1 n=1 Tax=Antechinus flavipes TaxID=38775 RepID=UPI0022365D19|nr:kunitz-type protease inhibitor 2 isoform X1 [Antechinus flavipes]
MRQQLLRGPPLSSVLLVLLGALLLTGAAWGLDDHPASPSGAKEQPGLQDLCRSPKMVGRCRASIPRWWYNVTAQACHSFLYGGCGGNYNNFLTRKDCIKACNGVAENSANEAPARKDGAHEPSPSAPRKQNSEEFPVTDFDYEEYCTAKAVTGPCRAAFPRWYFDAEKNTCVHFIYGGCRGNKNSYVNLEDCMTKCFGKRTHKASHPAMSHSTKAVALAVLLAVMAAILLGAMVVIFIKIARKHRASAFNTVWSPIDDKEYLVKSAYTI